MLRFDYTISSKDSFWANYNYDDGNAGRPPADPNFFTGPDTNSSGMAMQGLAVVPLFDSDIRGVASINSATASVFG